MHRQSYHWNSRRILHHVQAVDERPGLASMTPERLNQKQTTTYQRNAKGRVASGLLGPYLYEPETVPRLSESIPAAKWPPSENIAASRGLAGLSRAVRLQ